MIFGVYASMFICVFHFVLFHFFPFSLEFQENKFPFDIFLNKRNKKKLFSFPVFEFFCFSCFIHRERTDVACLNVLFSWCNNGFSSPGNPKLSDEYIWNRWRNHIMDETVFDVNCCSMLKLFFHPQKNIFLPLHHRYDRSMSRKTREIRPNETFSLRII